MKRWIAFIGIVVLAACSTVPLSNRKRTAWLPSSELNSMAAAQYSAILDSIPTSRDRSQVQMVQNAGNRIKAAVITYLDESGFGDRVEGFEWEFNLLVDDVVNAWCMPGGKVAFYSGIMPICQDETGVAVVMGHEIAHAVAEHGNERMTHGMIQQFGGIALAVALSDKPAATQNLFLNSYGVASTVGGMLPFSRKHELEADELGLYFMALAGYNPQKAPKFWERMSSANGGTAHPEFMSTHPSHSTRISNLNKWMPKAMEYYNR
jgi:predicted Zn-dependent protease